MVELLVSSIKRVNQVLVNVIQELEVVGEEPAPWGQLKLSFSVNLHNCRTRVRIRNPLLLNA